MRYSDEAPKNVMDYLFVELLQWGREEGYQAFEFGMAPLAGLEDRPLIAAIGVQLAQERMQRRHIGHQQNAAVAVLNIGRVDNGMQQQAFGID